MTEKLQIPANRWLRWNQVVNRSGRVHYRRLPLILLPWHWGTLYLHRFMNTDDCRDPHDHPKWFISIGLKGQYTERVFERRIYDYPWNESGRRMVACTTFKAPWIRFFRAEHAHLLDIDHGECWTLVITGPRTRRWGFLREDGSWMEAHEYNDMLNEEAA